MLGGAPTVHEVLPEKFVLANVEVLTRTMAPLFLRLAFQFFHKALPDTVEPRQESAPQMLVAPEIVSSFGVYYGQAGESRGGLLVVIGHRIFRHVDVLDAAGLATSEDDIATFIGIG